MQTVVAKTQDGNRAFSGQQEDDGLAHAPCRILIADDHAAIRRGVLTLPEFQDDWQVVAEVQTVGKHYGSPAEPGPTSRSSTIQFPQMNGLELTHRIKAGLPRTWITIHTIQDFRSGQAV
jgi:DNA-binding NarL/FixJ family response regulator